MLRYNDIQRIHIELTARCNASCPGCPRNVWGGYAIPELQKTEWTLKQFEESFSGDFLRQLDRILFCGNYGDPGPCRELISILQYIRNESSVEICLHTNGGMRNEQFWFDVGTVLQHNSKVIWSFDGLEDTNHLYRKGVNWDRAWANAQSYISAGGHAVWEMLVFKHNEHQVEQCKELSEQYGFKQFIYKRALGFEQFSNMQVLDKRGKLDYDIVGPSQDYSNIANANSPQQLPEQTEPYTLEKYKQHNNNQMQRYQRNEFVFKHTKDIHCETIHNKEIYVDSAGTVYPCCHVGHASQHTAGELYIQNREWLLSRFKQEQISCKVNKLKDIVDSYYFKTVESTWGLRTDNQQRIAMCSTMCSKHKNKMQSVYESVRNVE